jgi:hypothetical protein
MAQRWHQEGQGWRLGWNGFACQYPALIGGEGWAVELTAQEAQTLARLLGEIRQVWQSLAQELMAEEHLSCEIEAEGVWLEAQGTRAAYGLRLMVLQGRNVEGSWSALAVEELAQALAACPGF